MHLSPNPGMAGSNIDCEHGACEMEEGYVMVSRKHRVLRTAVKGNLDFKIYDNASGGSYAAVSYTHLDVYKRQRLSPSRALRCSG